MFYVIMRQYKLLSLAIILALCGMAVAAEKSPADIAKQPAAKPGAAKPAVEKKADETKPPAKKELSPAMVALRDRVRAVLAAAREQPVSTAECSVTDVINYCLAFGCGTVIHHSGEAGQTANGITCLCWNIPCAGREPLVLYQGHLAPRTGYGYQETPSQLAAMLALSQVGADYPARVGQQVRTVSDLVEYEKLSCRSGGDLAWKLIALSQYVREPNWKNDLGEEWSVERIVKEELARPANPVDGGTTRLLALSFALQRQAAHHQISGEFVQARRYVEDAQDYFLRIQNADGSWGRVSAQDYPTALMHSGQVLEFLVLGLPADRLEAPQLVRSVEFVTGLLEGQRWRGDIRGLSSRELGAVTRAWHGLAMYDARVFVPADPPPAKDAPAKEAAQ
jgi:hypothetical protein